MWKQVVIARKDLNMSPGKLSAQTGHGYQAYFTNLIKNATPNLLDFGNGDLAYMFEATLDKDMYEQWIDGIFTKVCLAAKNRNHLLKAKTAAEELGLKEGIDFFLIKDCCLTELEPEEVDENGIGRTLTCIGFRPLPSEIIDQIGKKYQLYK